MKSFSKSNFVKVLGATTLATLIATAGIFAFTPLGANAQASSSSQNSSLNNNVNNSTSQPTESAGLITPRADDPVLFTTESGLEIKYGQAMISSANLNGFFYFSSYKNDVRYDWVVIGLRNGIMDMFDNTAASIAISTDKFAHLQQRLKNSSLNVAHIEIPAGGMLCLANFAAETCSATQQYNWFGDSNIKTKLEGYYTNDTFGLQQICTLPSFSISHSGYSSTGVKDTYMYVTLRYFILGYSLGKVSYKPNFYAFDYLTNEQARYTSDCWDTRYWETYSSRRFTTSGETALSGTGAIRPACVVQLK